MTRRGAILLVSLLLSSVAAQQGPPVPIAPLCVLHAESVGQGALALKLLIFNAGASYPTDGQARLVFNAPGQPPGGYEGQAPGPRPCEVPVRTSAWAPDHVELVRFGAFTLGQDAPAELEVRGGLAGQEPALLGRILRRETPDGTVRTFFQRTCGQPAEDPTCMVAAVFVPHEDRRFSIKLAYLNCGLSFETDQWAFLHFEPEPKGTNLDVLGKQGLHPTAQATDSAGWTGDQLTVLTFGPFTLPDGPGGPVYLFAGMYDRDGDGARLPLWGQDESQRVLVGQVLLQDGKMTFRRHLPVAEEDLP